MCFGCDFVFVVYHVLVALLWVLWVVGVCGFFMGFRWSSGFWFYRTRGERKLGEGSGKPNQRRERL